MDRGGGEGAAPQVIELPFQGLEKEFTDTQARVDFLVMPLLTLAFFALQLDRGNM